MAYKYAVRYNKIVNGAVKKWDTLLWMGTKERALEVIKEKIAENRKQGIGKFGEMLGADYNDYKTEIYWYIREFGKLDKDKGWENNVVEAYFIELYEDGDIHRVYSWTETAKSLKRAVSASKAFNPLG